jgi:hypothetical protein
MSENLEVAQFDHFIPVSTAELVRRLQTVGDGALGKQQIEIIDLLRQILSYQFNLRLNDLRKLYLPFNPDNELIPAPDQVRDIEACMQALRGLLSAANYTELDQQQIQYALEKTSPYGLQIHIDFDEFEHAALFYRGKSQGSVEVRDWKRLLLKKKTVRLINYQRLLLVLRFKPGKGEPGLHLKLFKNIPRPDLEMLFPNSRVRMKAFDKLKIAITGGGGTVGGLFATVGKISAAISPWTIIIALGGFGALLWRQVSKVLVQKTRYMATLAQNLYFHNLDNNAGAITYLVDMARQEEIKEAIMAYALLCVHQPTTAEQLDDICEQWFSENFAQPIDFDIEDALGKLERFGLIAEHAGKLVCIDTDACVQQLRQTWLTFIEP